MMQSLDPPVKPRAMQMGLSLVRLLLLSVGWLVLLIGVASLTGAKKDDKWLIAAMHFSTLTGGSATRNERHAIAAIDSLSFI